MLLFHVTTGQKSFLKSVWRNKEAPYLLAAKGSPALLEGPCNIDAFEWAQACNDSHRIFT